jgi:hypothetical protein
MSINFFEVIFNDTVLNFDGDTQVCCPFPHKVGNTEYYETLKTNCERISENIMDVTEYCDILTEQYNNLKDKR